MPVHFLGDDDDGGEMEPIRMTASEGRRTLLEYQDTFVTNGLVVSRHGCIPISIRRGLDPTMSRSIPGKE